MIYAKRRLHALLDAARHQKVHAYVTNTYISPNTYIKDIMKHIHTYEKKEKTHAALDATRHIKLHTHTHIYLYTTHLTKTNVQKTSRNACICMKAEDSRCLRHPVIQNRIYIHIHNTFNKTHPYKKPWETHVYI